MSGDPDPPSRRAHLREARCRVRMLRVAPRTQQRAPAVTEGGHIAQNVYRAAEAAGLGACMIDAYLDGEVNDLLQVDGRREAALGLLAIGPADHPESRHLSFG